MGDPFWDSILQGLYGRRRPQWLTSRSCAPTASTPRAYLSFGATMRPSTRGRSFVHMRITSVFPPFIVLPPAHIMSVLLFKACVLNTSLLQVRASEYE